MIRGNDSNMRIMKIAANLVSLSPGSALHSASSGLLLILGLIVFSVGGLLILGPNEFDRMLIVQLGLVYGIALVFILFHWPQIGLVVLLCGALLVNREIGTGTQTSLNAAFLLSPVVIGIWLIHTFSRQQGKSAVSSRAILPLILLMIAAILSFVVGQYPWFPVTAAPMPAQLGQLAVFLFSGGLLIVAAYRLQDLRWLRRISYLFISLGFIHLLAQVLTGSLSNLGSFLPQGVTQGSMFWTWLIAISFGQACLNREMHPMGRLALAAVAFAAMGFGLTRLESWMSGWLPALLSVGVILLFRFPVPFLFATPILILAALLGSDYLIGLATSGDNLYSLRTRVAAFESMVPILKANPLLGLGPANYYHYTSLFPIEGWYVKFNSHNTYIDLVSQTGLIGLGCFLWFGWASAKSAWDLRSRIAGGFESAYAYSVFAGIIATFAASALGDWAIPFVYNTGLAGFRTSILPWIFIGGLIALEQRAGRKT